MLGRVFTKPIGDVIVSIEEMIEVEYIGKSEGIIDLIPSKGVVVKVEALQY